VIFGLLCPRIDEGAYETAVARQKETDKDKIAFWKRTDDKIRHQEESEAQEYKERVRAFYEGKLKYEPIFLLCWRRVDHRNVRFVNVSRIVYRRMTFALKFRSHNAQRVAQRRVVYPLTSRLHPKNSAGVLV
jgi:hypothetical protein